MTIPVEFTPGDSSSFAEVELPNSPIRRRCKQRKRRMAEQRSNRFSLPASLSAESEHCAPLDMNTDVREHSTAHFFITYEDVWEDWITWEEERGGRHSDRLSTPLPWFESPEESSPG